MTMTMMMLSAAKLLTRRLPSASATVVTATTTRSMGHAQSFVSHRPKTRLSVVRLYERNINIRGLRRPPVRVRGRGRGRLDWIGCHRFVCLISRLNITRNDLYPFQCQCLSLMLSNNYPPINIYFRFLSNHSSTSIHPTTHPRHTLISPKRITNE